MLHAEDTLLLAAPVYWVYLEPRRHEQPSLHPTPAAVALELLDSWYQLLLDCLDLIHCSHQQAFRLQAVQSSFGESCLDQFSALHH